MGAGSFTRNAHHPLVFVDLGHEFGNVTQGYIKKEAETTFFLREYQRKMNLFLRTINKVKLGVLSLVRLLVKMAIVVAVYALT